MILASIKPYYYYLIAEEKKIIEEIRNTELEMEKLNKVLLMNIVPEY